MSVTRNGSKKFNFVSVASDHRDSAHTAARRPRLPEPARALQRSVRMSNQAFSNEWLATGQGPGSKKRPGFSRYDARNALIRHHNYRGEAVFLAARRWHHSRAHNQAARLRLDKAYREASEAEMEELMALRSMGIGARNSNFLPATAPKPGGAREALEKRLKAEAAEEALEQRRFQTGSRARSDPLARPGVDDSVTKTGSGDARSAWLAKMSGGGMAPDAPTAIASIETKKPRKAAKAATTRD